MGNYAENLKGSVPSPTYDLGLKFLVSQFTHLLNGYNGICLAQKEILWDHCERFCHSATFLDTTSWHCQSHQLLLCVETSFLGKVIEKVVVKQFWKHLRVFVSLQTPVSLVLGLDIVCRVHYLCCFIAFPWEQMKNECQLILLALSAASVTTDYVLVLTHPWNLAKVDGVVLEWFHSFLL